LRFSFHWALPFPEHIMTLYRCHFLDAHDHIEAREEIDAVSLIDAIDRSNAMLDHRSHHHAVEVWAGNRWVYRAGRIVKMRPESATLANSGPCESPRTAA